MIFEYSTKEHKDLKLVLENEGEFSKDFHFK